MNDDFFNPNNYTKDAMPLVSALFVALDENRNLCALSDNVSTIKEKYSKTYQAFEGSLSKGQKALLNDIEWGVVEKETAENMEYFCKGARVGAVLIKELLGINEHTAAEPEDVDEIISNLAARGG